MAVIHVPLFPDNKEKNKVQSEYVKNMLSNGWVTTSSVFDKEKKTVVETILLTPDTSMPGYAPLKAQSIKTKEEINPFSVGEPVKVISNPDPSWNDPEGNNLTSFLIGKTGKFFGVFDGDTKYKGYAVVRMDEYDYRLSTCEGKVSDGYGFFCKLSSLISLAEKEEKTDEDAPLVVGGVIKITANPNPGMFGSDGKVYIGKEGVYLGATGGSKKGYSDIEIANNWGSTDVIQAVDGSFHTTSLFIPKNSVDLASGDIVKIIATDGTIDKSWVDRIGYICGPLVPPGKVVKNQMDKIRVQVGIIGTIGAASYNAGTKYSEQRISVNVNCLEVVPPEEIFSGIKIGDTVTIIDIPDYPKMEVSGKGWIGREGKFLGFPKEKEPCAECGGKGVHTDTCKTKSGLHYRYKYTAELEVDGGKKLYAFVGTIAKGTAKKLGYFKIGDSVILKDAFPEFNITQQAYDKKYKGLSAQVSDIFWQLGSVHHGKLVVTYPTGNITMPKECFTGAKE